MCQQCKRLVDQVWCEEWRLKRRGRVAVKWHNRSVAHSMANDLCNLHSPPSSTASDTAALDGTGHRVSIHNGKLANNNSPVQQRDGTWSRAAQRRYSGSYLKAIAIKVGLAASRQQWRQDSIRVLISSGWRWKRETFQPSCSWTDWLEWGVLCKPSISPLSTLFSFSSFALGRNWLF